jgi:3-oxoadipate enol-lactonase
MKTEDKLKLKDGDILAYTDYPGEGIPIILIHGFPLNQKIWKGQVEELTKAGRRVITYDMRGFGESPDPTKEYSHEDDLKQLTEELELKECQLVGMSFGGEIATSFTVDNPNLVKELTLIGSGIDGFTPKEQIPFDRWKELVVREGKLDQVKKELLAYGELGEMSKNKPELHKQISEIVNEYRGYFFKGDKRKYPDPRTIHRLSEIKCPTNIIIGLDDSRDSLEQTRELATRIPDVNLEVVEGSGHFVSMENAEVVNQVVLHSEIRKE